MVWFDPELSVGYRPRGTLKALATQYYEYGRWKAEVLRRYPGSLRLRQVVPPAALTTVAAAAVVSTRWRPAMLVPALYLTVLLAAVRTVPRPATAAGAAAVVHASWTTGLLYGLVRRPRVAL